MATYCITAHDLMGRPHLQEADRIVARLEQCAREREQRREQHRLEDANGEWSFDLDEFECDDELEDE